MVKQRTVHDGNTRKDASVTMHGVSQLASNEQWEVNINPHFKGADDPSCHSWLPRSGTDRPQPHKKINDQDH